MKSVDTILILAGDSDGNLGDRAIVQSTCDELRRLNPEVKIFVMTDQGERARLNYGATPLRRGLLAFPAVLKAAWQSDLVLVGGGGLFQDDDSLIKMPYWGLRVACTRVFAWRIRGYSIGAGPLQSRVSRVFAALALACMESISVRDEGARAALQSLTRKTVQVVPDPAILLQSAPAEAADAVLQEAGLDNVGAPLVGITVRKWFHQVRSYIPHKYAVKYKLRNVPGAEKRQQMVALIARALDRMIEEQDVHVVFMPTYNVSHEGDEQICREIIAEMFSDKVTLLNLNDARLYMAVASRLTLMIGGRMHPAILSSACGVPVVGLSYNQKFRGFFEHLDIPGNVLDINDFVEYEQIDKLLSLVDRTMEDSGDMSDRVQRLQQELRRFNESVLQ
jgi:polysaccharide pyruvyl transferase CsaB